MIKAQGLGVHNGVGKTRGKVHLNCRVKMSHTVSEMWDLGRACRRQGEQIKKTDTDSKNEFTSRPNSNGLLILRRDEDNYDHIIWPGAFEIGFFLFMYLKIVN